MRLINIKEKKVDIDILMQILSFINIHLLYTKIAYFRHMINNCNCQIQDS